MSVSTRLISGSVASWAQIGITFITQMLLVPVYLSYWDVASYGLWLAILTLGYLLTALDFGHQEYLAYELLRIGKQNRKEISRYLYSGILMGFILGIVQFPVIFGLYEIGFLNTLGDAQLPLTDELGRTTLTVLVAGS